MCRKTEQNALQALPRPSRAVLALGLVVLLFGWAFNVAAQSDAGTSTDTDEIRSRRNVRSVIAQYIPKGYSIEGSLTVVTATTEVITFFSGNQKNPITLKLKDTQYSVKDLNNNAVAFNTLVNGVKVYVCRSADKRIIIIFVVPSQKKENSNV